MDRTTTALRNLCASPTDGTCTTGRCDSSDESISRATNLLSSKGFGEYDLFENNCEAFAIYCKTGKHMSGQAFSAVNLAKHAVKSFLKNKIDRLLQDVQVHDPTKLMELKQTIETQIKLPFKEMIANLEKLLNKDVDQDELDEVIESMEKEEDKVDASESSSSLLS
ncbi:uncharacterized protein LOC110752539 [Prunus avium]|uniref:Uncharacterized protein LOC110752538 n=1 Tax=Prunus avium TaxID=42229 RepID=A0A6P5S5W3_PRUAV|nr:uncharacterized protein LOC110752538 [Prunus avium]XP_021808912.1 uncharacterized protein LOC110752539 [Prunus avium]